MMLTISPNAEGDLMASLANGRMNLGRILVAISTVVVAHHAASAEDNLPRAFFETHCYDCHNASSNAGGLDLTALPPQFSNVETFARWVKIHDRLEAGEMPPRDQERPPAAELKSVMNWLRTALQAAEQTRFDNQGRTPIRRLTRAEYENTIRDLFELDGITLANELPADGSAHGFDTNSDALDISHVNLAKYLEAADRTLDMAIAVQPEPPPVVTQRISLANPHGFVAHVLLHGDGVLLKDKKHDPEFAPAGAHMHLNQGAHERIGSFHNGASVGIFRHEDESFHPYFNEFVAMYPGRYRVRTSLWSFQWDQGQVLPARGTEAVRLSIVTLTGDGRGGGHPSTLLAYFDAPSLHEQVHEVETWLNIRDTLGFNAASLAPGAQTRGKRRALGFTGPGIACDWLDVEGPLHDVWPPVSHRRLFGDMPLTEFKPADHPGVKPPKHLLARSWFPGKNRPEPVSGIWTVMSEQPLADADQLLADFLPRAFRRPVSPEVRKQYVAQVGQRLAAGDCFETAMRWAYRAALCSPDFLYHVEPSGTLDDFAFANRLSYFFWNSMPDSQLMALAESDELHSPDVLHREVERLLQDPKSQRFVENFVGQWLKLRQIAATDPDRKLYPEFNVYLQDSMVAETRSYFRELLEQDHDVSHLIRGDFAMLNEKLAVHYGIPNVTGSQIRKVSLPEGCPRGGFLTQAAILKITANGTTTSPVPRGAFVMDRLLGLPPDPPPPNIPVVEPDVRGATTIRAQLEKHRSLTVCASCHARMDPPGFALEAFDVIGGFRERYRSIGEGDPPLRGSIDPFIGLSFKLGPPVDASGVLPDERAFQNIREYQSLVASDLDQLLKNMTERFAIYSTGRAIAFSDRAEIARIVAATRKQGSGLRTLIHELVQSPLFQTR